MISTECLRNLWTKKVDHLKTVKFRGLKNLRARGINNIVELNGDCMFHYIHESNLNLSNTFVK